ncbi:MAG: nucleoside-triphosphatase [Anaerolineaceae bacterium]
MGEIIGLTGSKGKGKSFACMELAGRLIDKSVLVKGFYSPPVFTEGVKTAIDVVSLPSFERKQLGVIGEIEGYVQIRVWSMNPATFEWINRQLKRLTSTDVLMIDEFGPLEVEQQKGWFTALEVLKTAKYHLAVITFRPEYQEYFKQEFTEIKIINLDKLDSPEYFYAEVEKRLLQARVIKAESNG